MSTGKLAGRRILVTGAGSGIGKAVATLFASEGARLALLDINSKPAADIAAGTGGIALDVDVTDENRVIEAVEQSARAMKGIDGVVNAAGIVSMASLPDTSLETWQRVIAVNLTGPFLICRSALPWLRQSPGSTIVTIASAQALRPLGAGGAYSASKAGVMNFTKTIAAELAPHIRANVICPGAVDTPMVVAARAEGPQRSDALRDADYALQRMAQPEEIAAAVLFLTSTDSSFVTGAALAVDGGRTFH